MHNIKHRASKFLAAILVLSTVLCGNADAYAHDGTEHNKELEKVLFGENFVKKSKSNDFKEKLNYIEEAAYFCIDQFNHNGEARFNALKKKMFPLKAVSFSGKNGIDFSAASSGEKSHRNYTHRGWNNEEVNFPPLNIANWQARKEILLETVNGVFPFGFRSNKITGFSSQCDAFCQLIYYVHILGDHEEDVVQVKEKIGYGFDTPSDYKAKDQKMEIGGRHDKNDIISNLEESLKVLFQNQDCTKLIRELDDLNKQAGEIYNSRWGAYNEENYVKYEELAQKVLNVLSENVPQLLANEEFFNKVFS